MQRSFLVLGSLCLAVAACDRSPTDAAMQTPAAHAISFDYLGMDGARTIAGRYEAHGFPRPEAGSHTYAVGLRDAATGALEIRSMLLKTADVISFLSLDVPHANVGTYTIDTASCHNGRCAEMVIALDVPNVHGAQAEYSCRLESGTIRVTESSGSRVAGDFAGQGSCIGSTADRTLDEFSVTSGRFDVELVAGTR